MLGWLTGQHRKDEAERRKEELRLERGKFAETVIKLGQRRHAIEQLVKQMLEERHRA